MRARRVSRRWKNRQCRSVHSIIGAIQNFRPKPFILLAVFARSSGLERRPNRAARFLHALLFFYDHPRANGKASAGIDALRAHGAPTATFTLFGSRRCGLSGERNWK